MATGPDGPERPESWRETIVLRELPLDGPGFAEIIDRNLLCADKTLCIHKMLTGPSNQCHLMRSRGFRKSLSLDTVKEVVTGDSSRFKDLWIGGGPATASPGIRSYL